MVGLIIHQVTIVINDTYTELIICNEAIIIYQTWAR
jgi:hypothetical protein